MQFQALLLSRDEQVVQVLTRSLVELGIVVELCTDLQRAAAKLGARRFHAILVDGDDERAAALVFKTTKAARASERPLTVVLVGAQTDVRAAFESGAQVALYKPISLDRVRHGLRAARNLMARERRRGQKRVPVEIAGSITWGDGKSVPVSLSDLSEGGALVGCSQPLPTAKQFLLEFFLPHATEPITADAEVVWQNVRGQSGLRFSYLGGNAHSALAGWLKKNPSGVLRTDAFRTQQASAGI